MEPGFIAVGVDMGAAFRASLVTKTSCKSFIEPEVIPPLHGYKVAEPHVTELVLDHYAEEGELWNGHMLLRAHDFIRVCDAADIFHGSVLVIRAHDVINFSERISSTKALLVKVESGLCDSKHELVSEELNKRLSDKDSLWHIHGVIVLEDLIWACADGIQVSGDSRGLLKFIDSDHALVFIKWQEPFDSSALKHVSTTVRRIAERVALFDGV